MCGFIKSSSIGDSSVGDDVVVVLFGKGSSVVLVADEHNFKRNYFKNLFYSTILNITIFDIKNHKILSKVVN